jgi:NAD/NADP transhydrogenase beta subunit
MSADLAALLYLGAAILFILSLQGLSSPCHHGVVTNMAWWGC